MPISRKSDSPQKLVAPAEAATRQKIPAKSWWLPRRVVALAIFRDESGSMSPWRSRQGEFIPRLCQHVIEVGGDKVADFVYLLYVVVSGGVVHAGFAPLRHAADPAFEPDGMTPLGQGFSVVAEKCDDFFTHLFENEVTVRDFEVAIFSDLQATGESAEETETGITKFLEMVKKYRGKVTIIGPTIEAMNADFAKRLDVNERGIKSLDSTDPKAVYKWTFDSLMQMSRKASGGSKPSVRVS